jgi:hypothetical protein
MGTAAATAGAAGPARDYRQDGAAGGLSRSTRQHSDYTFTEQADASVRCTGLGARSCYGRQDTGRAVYCPIISVYLLKVTVNA